MKLFELVARRQWTPVVGYLTYIAVLTAGYYYNLTFVQLGVIDLGTRLVGLDGRRVSLTMAALALSAFVVAVVTGRLKYRSGWSSDLRTKIRMLFIVIAVQTALTVMAPGIRSPGAFTAWVLVCSATIGVDSRFCQARPNTSRSRNSPCISSVSAPESVFSLCVA